jgi:hypothetical protein
VWRRVRVLVQIEGERACERQEPLHAAALDPLASLTSRKFPNRAARSVPLRESRRIDVLEKSRHCGVKLCGGIASGFGEKGITLLDAICRVVHEIAVFLFGAGKTVDRTALWTGAIAIVTGRRKLRGVSTSEYSKNLAG